MHRPKGFFIMDGWITSNTFLFSLFFLFFCFGYFSLSFLFIKGIINTTYMNELKKPIREYGKGFCGIGVYMPKSKENIGTLIRSAKMFGVDFVFMIGEKYVSQSSAVKLDEKIPIFYFKDFKSFCDSMPPVEKFTVIELTNSSVPLDKYEHRKKGIYILGSEDKGIPKEILESDRCEFVEIEGNSSLNVAVAGSIVLYKRFVQWK